MSLLQKRARPFARLRFANLQNKNMIKNSIVEIPSASLSLLKFFWCADELLFKTHEDTNYSKIITRATTAFALTRKTLRDN